MNIKLERPIVTFDIESTGLNVSTDRIIEIAILKNYPDGKEEELVYRINPEREIPTEIIALTGISNEDVKNQPKFSEVAQNILNFIEGCDLVGYNFHKLDIPLLAEEFLRINIDFDIDGKNLIDVQNIYHKLEPRTLSAAYKFYLNKDLENAHSAMADTKATWEILNAQIVKYNELTNDTLSLANFSKNSDNKYADFAGRLVRNESGDVLYNFGKHKGKTVLEIHKEEPGYYGWFIGATTDFPNYTKKILRKEMERLKELYPDVMKTQEKRKDNSNKDYHKKGSQRNESNESFKREQQSLDKKLEALKNKFNR